MKMMVYGFTPEIREQIPKQFNPNEIKYSSLFAVIDKLQDAKILGGIKAPPRRLGVRNLNLTSDFIVTQQALDFAYALGINIKTVKVLENFHVRLRNPRNSS